MSARRTLSKDKQLNPVFHLQTKAEDEGKLSIALIKSARQTGALNLSGRGLAIAPHKVYSIHEPEKEDLDVRYDLNKTHDDDMWWNQKPLTNLDLSSNSLTTISSQVEKLTELAVLNLSDNAITTLPVEIGYLTRLSKLNLSRNKLSVLPDSLYHLPNLKILKLSYNEFCELAPAIADLHLLEDLDISHNKLTKLPQGIGFLSRLNSLNAQFNKLKKLPNDITSLRALQKLELNNNDLEKLPHQMGELRKLECLYAQHNNLKELPNFEGCENLKEILLADNLIAEIKPDFCEALPMLKTLDLKDNKIEKIPNEIEMMHNLSRLDLSNNTVMSIPNSLSTLCHLVNLQLDGNPIRSIRRDIIQGGTARIMKVLRDRAAVQADCNTLCQSSSSGEDINYPNFNKMTKTRSLAMANKDLEFLPDGLLDVAQEAEVSTFDISKNKFVEVPEHLKCLSKCITDMDLSFNRIKMLPRFLGAFQKLSYLNLANNALTSLPDELRSLQQLRELNVINNKFRVLPDCIYNLRGLEILLARDNQIEQIDASGNGFGAMRRLCILDLANNNIDYIPPMLGYLKNITTLELTGNRFRNPRHQILQKGTEAIMSYLRDRVPT